MSDEQLESIVGTPKLRVRRVQSGRSKLEIFAQVQGGYPSVGAGSKTSLAFQGNMATTIHRIYTESKNDREIIRLASMRFDSFTVQPTAGYYQGKGERSIVLEVVGARQRDVDALAESIRRTNGQKSVLIVKTRGTSKVTRK